MTDLTCYTTAHLDCFVMALERDGDREGGRERERERERERREERIGGNKGKRCVVRGHWVTHRAAVREIYIISTVSAAQMKMIRAAHTHEQQVTKLVNK